MKIIEVVDEFNEMEKVHWADMLVTEPRGGKTPTWPARHWIPIDIPNPEKLPFNEFGSLVMSAVAQWLCQVRPEIVGGTGVLLHHASVGLDSKATIAFSHLQTGKIDPDIDRLRLLDLTVKLLGWQFTEVKERVTAEAERGVARLQERIALSELAKAAEKQ